ncbi:MAG: hypothetical protein ACTSR1_01015 [Candidatus Heimdallarchaeota archaeon]
MKKEFNLSERMSRPIYTHGKLDNGIFLMTDVKEFIKRRIIDLEQEQKHAKGEDWKRGLVLLKANLEKDAGEKLI